MSCFCNWKGKNQKSNCGRWDRKSFTTKPNYSAAQKKRKKTGWILDCFILGQQQESTPHARLMTNPPIAQLKWNWIEPPGHESKCDCGQTEPLPLPPVAWTPPVCTISSDSSPRSWGRVRGTRVPWRPTRGWRFGKSTLTPVCCPFGTAPPPPIPHPRSVVSARLTSEMTPEHCPCQSFLACLTLNSQKDLCFKTGELRHCVFNYSLQHLERGWNKHNKHAPVFVLAFCHSIKRHFVLFFQKEDRLNIWSVKVNTFSF